MPKASTLPTTSPATVTALREVLGVDDVLGTVNIYDDTTDGIAATVDGDYFSVPSAEDDEYLILYRNEAESATEVKRFPSNQFLQAGTGAVPRTWQNKAGEIPSVTDWFSPAERADALLDTPLLDHTDAIQAAVTARAGKALHFPDGHYANTATPTGIDAVHCTGTPRVQFTGTPLPLFMGVFTGNVETAIVAGVIRYYASGDEGAGWYFLADQGSNHDPILLGPVTATGGTSVVLEVNLSDFGLDPDLWTPAGFVCDSDNTLALSGCTFGASVTNSTVQVYGSYGANKAPYVNYNGSAWTGSNAPYTYAWTSGASAKLTVTRTAGSSRQSYASNGVHPVIVPRISAGETPFLVALDAASASSYEVRFFEMDGTPILTESSRLKFYVSDPVLTPKPFPFNVAPADTSANIWMVGMFRRKPASY